MFSMETCRERVSRMINMFSFKEQCNEKSDTPHCTDVNTLGCDFISPSYPKVGNTWVRYMLGTYYKNIYSLSYIPLCESADFEIIKANDQLRPVGVFTHGPFEWLDQDGDYFCYENTVAPYLHLKVIFIVRHPLDILVSYYMQASRKKLFTGSLCDFIFNKNFGVEKLNKFFMVWSPYINLPNVFVLRYEVLVQDTLCTFEKLIKFIGLPWDKMIAGYCISECSFQKMQDLEKSNRNLCYRGSSNPVFGCEQDGMNPDTYHVRRGVVGGYREYITKEQHTEIIKYLENLCQVYGYKTTY